MVTASCTADVTVLRFDALANVLRARRPQPHDVLIALRARGFAELAWRRGRGPALQLERRAAVAFRQAAARILRAGDAIAHEPGTDLFLIALFAPPRTVSQTTLFREAMHRIALHLSAALHLSFECGWEPLDALQPRWSVPDLAAAALERGEREAERYDFFAAIGHELRTPLTSIRGYLETVLEMPIANAAAQRFLQTARNEAVRMGRLLEGMFEFSLLDLSASLPAGLSDASEELRRACAIVAPLAAARETEIHCTAVERCTVAVDGDLLLQSLVNLLENAVKYGRPGGRVFAQTSNAGARVQIVIEDDGPGVEAPLREAIFGYRKRASQGSAPGSGIGLSIVKTIVERSGGRIVCDASARGGARFSIGLPGRAEFSAQTS